MIQQVWRLYHKCTRFVTQHCGNTEKYHYIKTTAREQRFYSAMKVIGAVLSCALKIQNENKWAWLSESVISRGFLADWLSTFHRFQETSPSAGASRLHLCPYKEVPRTPSFSPHPIRGRLTFVDVNMNRERERRKEPGRPPL